MKGFKVSDAKRTKLVGVACKSLEELVAKSRTKLQIPSKSNVRVFLSDGTEVESEEYFQTLPSQTILFLKQDCENLLTGADLIYNTLRYVNIDFLRAGEKVKEFFDENIKEKIRVLAEVVNETNNTVQKTFLSNKKEDPDWFFGLETNSTTKEAFMFRRSQERIRGYLYKTKSDIKKSSLYMNNGDLRGVLDNVFTHFSLSLSKDKYFGCFFDRSATGALCDETGQFKCSGVWKQKECLHNGGKSHLINPYSSREERIVFSTWNLDHCIERSRSIIPALMSAAEFVACNRENDSQVNVPYFYSLLFTNRNLRLVHIVCHDKGKHHSAQCDPNKFTVFATCKNGNFTNNQEDRSGVMCKTN